MDSLPDPQPLPPTPDPVIAPEAQPLPPSEPVIPDAPDSAPTPTRSFVPPPRQPQRWRKLVLVAFCVLAVLVLVGGAAYWWHWQTVRNNPTTVFQDALQSSLATNQVQANTTTPTGTIQVDYDFTSLKNPLVSSQATVQLYGAQFQVEGYGSAQNTYASYAKFPASMPASITNVAQNSWVQLRSKGIEPPTVSAVLSNLDDPRYQDFGPLVFGNFPAGERTRLVNFLLAQHIYAYQAAKVSKTALGGAKVFAYPVTLNINYLKIFIQSAAASEGFDPSEVQTAVNALNAWRGSTVTLYVSASTHRFVEALFRQGGQQTTTTYSAYNTASLLNEPETNLTWQYFLPVQLQIEQLAAAHEAPAALDAQRRADLQQLHDYLVTFFTANGFYPTYPELNNLPWVATNLPGVDPDALRDPLGSTGALSTAPHTKSYAYQPVTPRNTQCSNDTAAAVSQLCSSYTLTAILSNGQPYTVTSP